ncbi:hypothetical protein E2C01_087091 [Portunus trituberculatus]|uniref:Uncharacterized protein n=1 Tax=Portunus trituberculatus TaxID=210409 RepID=A0A5B7J781_PORTR|nr:hypothetical protein [Portunus trituberculatus]
MSSHPISAPHPAPRPWPLRSGSPGSTLSVDTLSVGGGSRANSLPRPTSPSPSVMSDKPPAQEDPAVSIAPHVHPLSAQQIYIFLLFTIVLCFIFAVL